MSLSLNEPPVVFISVRQFAVDEKGKETTSNFYTEEQFIAVFTSDKEETLTKCSFVCSEDCVLVVGNLNEEADMFAQYGQLENMTRRMIEHNASTVKDDFASYISASPEEWFRLLLQQRPDLLQRVPQHQLASYLGITPESLSRIKRRVLQGTTIS